MNAFSEERKWFTQNWTKLVGILLKSILALFAFGIFILVSIIVYLLVQDHLYNENQDHFNENGHEMLNTD